MDTKTNQRLALLGATLEALWNEATTWQRLTFPRATASSKIAHLRKEVEELADDPDDLAEHADAWLLLIGAAAALGHTPVELLAAIRAKLETNKLREWGEPDEDGVVEHVRDEAFVPFEVPTISGTRKFSAAPVAALVGVAELRGEGSFLFSLPADEVDRCRAYLEGYGGDEVVKFIRDGGRATQARAEGCVDAPDPLATDADEPEGQDGEEGRGGYSSW